MSGTTSGPGRSRSPSSSEPGRGGRGARGRGARPPRLWLAGLALASALWGIESCGLAPRSPEPPNTNAGRLVGLSDPDSVLIQIEVGLSSGVVTQYINAFADSFSFHPDRSDSTDLVNSFGASPDVFLDWGKDTERSAMQLVLGSSTDRSVTFTKVSTEVETGDRVVWLIDYTLVVDAATLHGRPRFDIRREPTGDWHLLDWTDFRQPGSNTAAWGFLKGRNRP